MILPKTKTQPYKADIPDYLEGNVKSTQYRSETDDYEVTLINERKVANYRLTFALKEAGLLDSVQQILSQATEWERYAWENALTISRYSPFVEKMRQALQMSHEQLDEIWDAAEKLEA